LGSDPWRRRDEPWAAPREGTAFAVRTAAEGPLDRSIFLAARRAGTGRPALKAISLALREQARALGLPGTSEP
jgi:hypothetical protein